MPKLDVRLEFSTVDTKNDGLAVIIVAAGGSTRMGGVDKMLLNVMGVPVLARTMKAFDNSPYIKGITVVTREEKIAEVKRLAEKYAVRKLDFVVAGGACREESVKNGISLYRGREEKLLIHDGARPFVSKEVIKGVVEALKTADSVTCAVRVKDTIKRVSPEGFAEETLDRGSLVAVQTPQGVNAQRFLDIAGRADLSLFTDDTSVMESDGIKTVITEGDYKNIKITTPEDVVFAEGMLGEEF